MDNPLQPDIVGRVSIHKESVLRCEPLTVHEGVSPLYDRIPTLMFTESTHNSCLQKTIRSFLAICSCRPRKFKGDIPSQRTTDAISSLVSSPFLSSPNQILSTTR